MTNAETVMTRYACTWSNRREDEQFSKERLDRVLMNEAWLDKYPSYGSDHFPIILHVIQGKNDPLDASNKPFKFEASWLHDDNFDSVVEETWSEARYSNGGEWNDWVCKGGVLLQNWDGNVYKKVPKCIK
ncbi:Mesocentin [Bienertia sinuspersici]